MNEKESIIWAGDINDDCTAIWRGLMLRAEEMEKGSWWWSVSMDEGRGKEIDSSNNEERECRSGVEARSRAEECARCFKNPYRRNNLKP